MELLDIQKAKYKLTNTKSATLSGAKNRKVPRMAERVASIDKILFGGKIISFPK